jgi:hypothetical protein
MSQQAAKAAWKKRKRGSQRVLNTVQDYVDLLLTGFDDMFEISVVPRVVVERLRAEIDWRRPAALKLVALELVDGSLQARINVEVDRDILITVHPDKSHEVTDLPPER